MNYPALCALRALWKKQTGLGPIGYTLPAGPVASLPVPAPPAIGSTSTDYRRAIRALSHSLQTTGK